MPGKLEGSHQASEVVEENTHQIGQLEDDLYPTSS